MKNFKWLFVGCLLFSTAFLMNFNEIVVNATSIRSGDFSYYELKDGTISIIKYYGTDEIVTIPSEIESKIVSKIDEHAFENNKLIKTINVPGSVKIIGENAFYYCKNLEFVFLSEGIETISRYSFSDCSKLKKINIPNSVKTIEDLAFSYCISLESIVIPNTVTSIKTLAFIGCCDSFIIYADSNSPLREEAKTNGFIFNCINHPQIIKDNEPLSPTCTQDGKTEGSHCSVCDYIVPAETIKATGHSWDEGIVTLEPTVTNEGEKLFTCKTCKAIETETIAKLPLPQTGNTVSKNAFKGINAKAKIKVPANKLKKYKNLMSKKGQKSTVKIVK